MATSNAQDIRAHIKASIKHMEHVLPGQAPIQDFVHHNTLHGYQHLAFPEALKQSHDLTGAQGYISIEQFRDYYRAGRVTDVDITSVLDERQGLDSGQLLFKSPQQTTYLRDVYITVLTQPLHSITGCQLHWQIDELDALHHFQAEVAPESRQRLLLAADGDGLKTESAAIADLWSACLVALGLEHYIVHPEDLLDLTPAQAEQILDDVTDKEQQTESGALLVDQLIKKEARRHLQDMLDQVGETTTLRGLLLSLTGEDLMDALRPQLQAHLASHLDQGLAAWHSRDRSKGFYASWRNCATRELSWVFDDLPHWHQYLEMLPDDSVEAIILELRQLGLPQSRWMGYLERLALELPGWSGMFLWRHGRPGYDNQHDTHIDMADYLAVRLLLERLFAHRLCRERWNIEPSLDMIRWHFRHHPDEFFVRDTVFNEHLPDYLVTRIQRLITHTGLETIDEDEEQWRHLAHLVWTWKKSNEVDERKSYSVYRSAWPLFQLAQHLGLSGSSIRGFDAEQVATVFKCLKQLDSEQAGYLRLQAFERHYREELLSAVANNHGKGRWQNRQQRPAAQIMVCMDDREEGLRRHLEELNPEIETLGAAGYFNFAINWQDIDANKDTALCPISQIPAHQIKEQAQPGQEAAVKQRKRGHSLRMRLQNMLHQETRRNLLASTALAALSAPGAFLSLTGKVLAPRKMGGILDWLKLRIEPAVATQINVNAPANSPAATIEHNIAGYTDDEQLTRLEFFLRNNGMTSGFATLVVLMGHASSSQNNPHIAAYGCGACSGRYGGPNARVFAAMINRPEMRTLLADHGIIIPRDTWFIGAQHNTCDDSVSWYDEHVIPEPLQAQFATLKATVDEATQLHALERCRRLASAPHGMTNDQAFKHVNARLQDFSQARPELGHACIASAFIGRRSLSRGLFLDRRGFLISYDPSDDADGELLERILLEVGPVGAGISLEYYFSTVDNDRYGCGSKVTHNVAGLFGVMEGTGSDLRTGLPKQMIEIHEPMRLLVIIEASNEMLTAIVGRQPPLQELILNEWILVTAVDPESGVISLFKPDQGFIPWQGEVTPLEQVDKSADWFLGHREPLPLAQIQSANREGTA
jgi:uncharacterized protein YbcC (UPF0753/DUF2309 family)